MSQSSNMHGAPVFHVAARRLPSSVCRLRKKRANSDSLRQMLAQPATDHDL